MAFGKCERSHETTEFENDDDGVPIVSSNAAFDALGANAVVIRYGSDRAIVNVIAAVTA
jgi:hypothetical protein